MLFDDPAAIATHVQTVAVLLGVAVSAIAILVQRRSASRLAAEQAAAHAETVARQAAVEFILRYEVHNPIWWEARLKAIEYLRTLSEEDRSRVAEAWSSRGLNDRDKEGLGNVVDWLNHLEIVAVAIDGKSLHRPTYARWQADALYENWTLASPLVCAMRKTKRGNDSLFEATQKLAESFKRGPSAGQGNAGHHV